MWSILFLLATAFALRGVPEETCSETSLPESVHTESLAADLGAQRFLSANDNTGEPPEGVPTQPAGLSSMQETSYDFDGFCEHSLGGSRMPASELSDTTYQEVIAFLRAKCRQAQGVYAGGSYALWRLSGKTSRRPRDIDLYMNNPRALEPNLIPERANDVENNGVNLGFWKNFRGDGAAPLGVYLMYGMVQTPSRKVAGKRKQGFGPAAIAAVQGGALHTDHSRDHMLYYTLAFQIDAKQNTWLEVDIKALTLSSSETKEAAGKPFLPRSVLKATYEEFSRPENLTTLKNLGIFS